jgi:uncharacterized protein
MTKRKFPIAVRSIAVDDMEIARDGRTVTAYAATFASPYPVMDFDGDYDEILNKTSFNRHLAQHGLRNVAVLFNHGLTVWGTPSEKFSQTLGAPLEVRPDGKGLLTVTRYNKNPLADEVLEMWANGDVRAQSFRGPIIRSAPRRMGTNGRTQIERLEMGLADYGPAPRVANVDAELVSIRSATLVDRILDDLDEEQIEQLRSKILAGTPLGDPSADPGTPTLDSPGNTNTPIVGDPPDDLDPSVELDALANGLRRLREPN